jgi:superfamily II DNA or RNA helicase
MEMKERSEILKDFRSGKTNFLCNCQLLTEGFDEPSINGLIMARPTTSRSLFIQMVGRGLRISPGKGKCKIIDIVDNHKLLSTFNHLICDDYFEPIEKFKSIRDIKDHIEKEALKISEFKIERADLLNIKKYHKLAPTQSMRTYLTKNKIEHHEPLSFDEGSFLMWMNELKKEYING